VRFLTVVGARPQFIKAAAVSRALGNDQSPEVADLREVLVHTGQHYDEDMSDVFFRDLQLAAPDHHLGVGSAPHPTQVARMMIGLQEVISEEAPDVVLAYGDTNSTLAAALTAAQLEVPFAHVEAGLRAHRMDMVEEINRVIADRLAGLLFAPSELAVRNLSREGISEGVVLVGDVMRDVLRWRLDRMGRTEDIVRAHGLREGAYVFVTVHRAENTDDLERLRGIMEALDRIAESGLEVVFPVHPRTRNSLPNVSRGSRVRTRRPLAYPDTVALMKHAHAVVTDSGGMQKEAAWLGVPCVTLRDETEWPETVEAGWNVLAGCDPEGIFESVERAEPPARSADLYGDGHAAERIVRVLATGSVRGAS
jgi:UDP-GlcNAc3NAcA epimerase